MYATFLTDEDGNCHLIIESTKELADRTSTLLQKRLRGTANPSVKVATLLVAYNASED